MLLLAIEGGGRVLSEDGDASSPGERPITSAAR
jgi:hypothetical protein